MGSRLQLPLFLLLVTGLVSGAAAGASAGDVQWVEVRSPNFSVVTDAGERRGRDVALRFEQMRAVFGTLMERATVNTPVPLQIIAFRSGKEMRQVSPIWKGKPTDVAGLFQGGQDRCFIMLDLSAESPWQVVFHEYAHQLMSGNLSIEPDAWFAEGFAEYFSSIEVDGKFAQVGKISHDEYAVLDQTAWLRIADLLRVQQYSKTYNENGDHRSVFYAESAMLVHYMFEQGMIAKMGDYVALVRDKRVPVDDAVQQAFGMSTAQLEKALRAYESTHHFKYYRLPAPGGIDSKVYTSAPISTADAQAVVADIHLHSLDYRDRAAEEFEAVLKLDPSNPAALRGLGYAYLIKQDYHRAGEYFQRAAERNPDDSRVLYYSAMLAQREGVSRSDTGQLGTMQKQLEASIKLDPNFADAYSLLAFTYLSQGKSDAALQTMIKAVQLNPGNEQYRFNLAGMCASNQKLDAARKILEDLKNSSDAVMASRADQELAHLQMYQEEQRFVENERSNSSAAAANPSVVEPQPAPVHPAAPAKFLKGKLVSVDCSGAPVAILTIVAGATTWKMRAADSAHTIVIGADNLSCAWANQKVAVNYRQTGDSQGDVISLEIQ